jgi:hypothetical protein
MQASRKKYGAKDVYVERFGKNLTQTFQQLLRCKTEDQVRPFPSWRHHGVVLHSIDVLSKIPLVRYWVAEEVASVRVRACVVWTS